MHSNKVLLFPGSVLTHRSTSLACPIWDTAQWVTQHQWKILKAVIREDGPFLSPFHKGEKPIDKIFSKNTLYERVGAFAFHAIPRELKLNFSSLWLFSFFFFFCWKFVEANSYLSEYNRSDFAIKMNNNPPTRMPSKEERKGWSLHSLTC